MSLTNSQIIAKMRLRGITTDVTDPEIVEAIGSWEEVVQSESPLEALGEFTTVVGQQEYDLFGAGGPLAGGLEVLEVYGNPAGVDLGLDVFGVLPLLQSLGLNPPLDGDNYAFNVPGDFLISDRVWAAYRERFGTARFIIKEGRLGSPILLDPVPGTVCTLVVRYSRPRTADELREDDNVLLNGVEWRCLLLMARKYALAAGVRIGDHEDKGATAKLFKDMADAMEKRALAGLARREAWTVNAAARS